MSGLAPMLVVALLGAQIEEDPVPILAVFDIQADEAPKRGLAKKLTEQLRVELAATKKVVIIDKGEQEATVRRMISEQRADSYRECVDEACQIPLGKELAASQILRTRLTRFDSSYLLSSELIDVKTAASIGGASVETDGSPKSLLAAVRRLAGVLMGTGPLAGGAGETVMVGVRGRSGVEAVGGRAGAEDGIVKFEGKPRGCSVWLDGRLLPGRTPFEDFLPLGLHRIKVGGCEALGRFKPHEGEVELKAGMSLQYELEEITGEVVVVARDRKGRLVRGSKILLDERVVARAPARLEGVSLGAHTVEIRSEDGRVGRRKLEVVGPDPVRLDVTIWEGNFASSLCKEKGVVCVPGFVAFDGRAAGVECEDAGMFGFADWVEVPRVERGQYCSKNLSKEGLAGEAFSRAYAKCSRQGRFCKRPLGEAARRPGQRKPLSR